MKDFSSQLENLATDTKAVAQFCQTMPPFSLNTSPEEYARWEAGLRNLEKQLDTFKDEIGLALIKLSRRKQLRSSFASLMDDEPSGGAKFAITRMQLFMFKCPECGHCIQPPTSKNANWWSVAKIEQAGEMATCRHCGHQFRLMNTKKYKLLCELMGNCPESWDSET